MKSKPAISIRSSLLAWYASAKRSLPWRADTDPYRVMVSELMLQQTQVKTALPYYAAFLKRFPTARKLAAASEQDVLAAWAGLGYYRRARFLQAAAKAVAIAGFPQTLEGLRELPGIGEYTAAAIGSICFGLPAAVVDGNVIRVVARLLALKEDAKSKAGLTAIKAAVADWMDAERPGDFNQAMMELGALVCSPKAPSCGACPVSKICLAYAEGKPEAYPRLPAAAEAVAVHKVVALVEQKGSLVTAQRSDAKGRMHGFWYFPEAEIAAGEDAAKAAAALARRVSAAGASLKDLGPCGSLKHSITRYRIDVKAFRFRLAGGAARAPWQLKALADFKVLPLASAEKRLLGMVSKPQKKKNPH